MIEKLVPIARSRWKGTFHPTPDPNGNRAARREVAKRAKQAKKANRK